MYLCRKISILQMEHQTQQNKRNKTWDYARGVAIVLIVIHHLYPRFHVDSFGHADSIVPSFCNTCQLPIFMYISGMLAYSSIRRYGLVSLLFNKGIRLLIPFLTFITIWAAIRPENAVSVLAEDFKDGYWFTFVLFEMITIMAISNYIANKTKIATVLLVITFYLTLTAYQIVVPRGNLFNNLFSINLFWHYFPFFAMGYYSNYIQWIYQKRYSLVYALVYFVSFFIYFHYEARAIISICNLSSLLLMITLFTHGIKPFENTFSIIGIYSLQIYLLHFFAKLFIRYISPIENPYKEFILISMLAAIIVIICISVSKLIMKSNMLALIFFGIKGKTSNV